MLRAINTSRRWNWLEARYVGTLHEINSENATVALENVSSFGTENRKTNPEDYIPPSDSVYEYIVFRGSDVKDLRIEQTPVAKENNPPKLNDPAILGVSAHISWDAVQLSCYSYGCLMWWKNFGC